MKTLAKVGFPEDRAWLLAPSRRAATAELVLGAAPDELPYAG
jgi:hypothetical protein